MGGRRTKFRHLLFSLSLSLASKALYRKILTHLSPQAIMDRISEKIQETHHNNNGVLGGGGGGEQNLFFFLKKGITQPFTLWIERPV